MKVAAAAAVVLASCLSVCLGQTIPEVATQAGFSTLVDFVVQAGLAETLSGPGPFTVFAPTNEAFAKLPPEVVQAVSNDVDLLRKVLTYHVVPGKVLSTDLSNDMTAASVEGTELRFNIYGGKTVTVNGKRVINADVQASNGVIHVIDEVIFPFPEKTIAGLVASDPRFSTLLAAVSEAGLVDTLNGDGPFTVLAPTNDAFAKVDPAALQSLLADKDALTKTLLRHVVPQTLFSKGLQTGTVTTAGGELIHLVGRMHRMKRSSSGFSGPTSKVVEADIIATNGVVHAIDMVL